MKKLLLSLLLVLASSYTLADSSIRSASGARCQSSDFQPFAVTVGLDKSSMGDVDSYEYNGSTPDEVYASVGISWSFGGVKPVDCNTFARKVEREQEAYTKGLEIKVQRLEAMLLKEAQVSAAKVKFR